jgi:hypothetical protein
MCITYVPIMRNTFVNLMIDKKVAKRDFYLQYLLWKEITSHSQYYLDMIYLLYQFRVVAE